MKASVIKTASINCQVTLPQNFFSFLYLFFAFFTTLSLSFFLFFFLCSHFFLTFFLCLCFFHSFFFYDLFSCSFISFSPCSFLFSLPFYNPHLHAFGGERLGSHFGKAFTHRFMLLLFHLYSFSQKSTTSSETEMIQSHILGMVLIQKSCLCRVSEHPKWEKRLVRIANKIQEKKK